MTIKFNLDGIPAEGAPVVLEVTLENGAKITQKGIIKIEEYVFMKTPIPDLLKGDADTITFINKDVISFTPTEGAKYDN